MIERAQILAEGDTITPDDLPEAMMVATPAQECPAEHPDALEVIERQHVADVLRRSDGNKVRAAKALGVSRRTIYRLIEKYGLQ